MTSFICYSYDPKIFKNPIAFNYQLITEREFNEKLKQLAILDEYELLIFFKSYFEV